nr:hypothetical protein [Leekyejoonella antrihumi]
MKQHATRRLVDVLATRHQLGPSGRQSNVDLDVVDTVPRQPVDLVHNDVVDLVCPDVVEHPLQRWAVGRASTFTSIGKLLHYLGVERRTLAQAGLTLRRDGEAFGFAAPLSLVSGADAQVDDGTFCGDRHGSGGLGHV